LEERCFHPTEAERVEDQSDDVDRYDRYQLLGRTHFELWYLDLAGQQIRSVEEGDRDHELIKEVEEGEIGSSVEHGFVADRPISINLPGQSSRETYTNTICTCRIRNGENPLVEDQRDEVTYDKGRGHVERHYGSDFHVLWGILDERERHGWWWFR
jgi:hypothetical protein